jgi:hypothetical protein
VDVTTRFYLLNLVGLISYTCLYVTVPLMFQSRKWLKVPAALNLVLVAAHAVCVCVMRNNHFGRVCSGDYLDPRVKQPYRHNNTDGTKVKIMHVEKLYLINTGRFLFSVPFYVLPYVLVGWICLIIVLWRRYKLYKTKLETFDESEL